MPREIKTVPGKEVPPRTRVAAEIEEAVREKALEEGIAPDNKESIAKIIGLAIVNFFKQRPTSNGQHPIEVNRAVRERMGVYTTSSQVTREFHTGKKAPKYPGIDDALGGYGTSTYDTPEDNS